MKIEIDDEIAKKCGLNEREALEFLAVAIYKTKGIHGALAGKILGMSEFEFHNLVPAKRETVNYGIDELVDDIK